MAGRRTQDERKAEEADRVASLVVSRAGTGPENVVGVEHSRDDKVSANEPP